MTRFDQPAAGGAGQQRERRRVRVWIVNINEPLPTDPGHNRLWRMGNVFDLLRARGHDVTWWTSTVHHFDKRLRHQEDTEVAVADNARIIHLHGRLYRRNISLARLLNHRTLGRRFRALAPDRPEPDIILASIPILDLPREVVRYARPRGIPVVIDIRDKWPDFMVDQVPKWAQPVARALLRPLFDDLREACRGATAIWGVTPSFVAWGLEHAGRPAGENDRYIPHAYPDAEPEAELLAEAGRFWDGKGIPAESPVPVMCFIGSLNYTAFDFETVVRGMRLLAGKVRLVVCGSGVGEAKLRAAAAGVPDIVFAGWVDGPALQVVMRRSVLGLTPYRNRANFVDNLPNKFLEYLSRGLPVVSCLEGFSRQVLAEAGAGSFYDEGDPQGFAGAVDRLLADPQARRTMSQAARRLFEARFRAETVYGQLVDHLEDLAGAR